MYLYGSRARDTAKSESDWDILILLKKDNITNQLEIKITDPLYEIELETGEVISPMIYSEKDYTNLICRLQSTTRVYSKTSNWLCFSNENSKTS